MIIAFLVLIIAVFSRILPFLLHVPALNFTAVGGSLLFFGARRPRWQVVIPVAALIASDILITVFGYHYAFNPGGYLVIWAWYSAVCLLGNKMLRRATAARVVGAVLLSSTSFFLLSNFVVWLTGHMYAKTLTGLGVCYIAALPFYRNDLASTAIVAAVLFALPMLVEHIVRQNSGSHQPV
jgi:hypothetical protein